VVARWTLLVAALTLLVAGSAWIWHMVVRWLDGRESVNVELELQEDGRVLWVSTVGKGPTPIHGVVVVFGYTEDDGSEVIVFKDLPCRGYMNPLMRRARCKFIVSGVARGALDKLTKKPKKRIWLSVRSVNGEIKRVPGRKILPLLKQMKPRPTD